MTTIKALREGIGALCETITTLPAPLGSPTAVYSDNDASFAEADLPIVVVRDGRGIAYQRLETDRYLATREMTAAFYLSRIADESYTIDQSSADLADECLDPILDFFMGYPNLNGLVRVCQIQTDSGVRTLMTRHNNSDLVKWRGVVIRLRVTYQRRYELKE